MKVSKIKELLDDGRMFSVTFRKNNGEVREMNARLGVSRYVTGKGMSYNPSEKNYLICYDVQKKGYRTVNISNVISIRCNGMEIKPVK